MEVRLATARLVLRPFDHDDIDALVRLDSDPEVRRFVEDGEPVGTAAAAETIDHWRRRYPPGTRFGFWAAVTADGGDFVGWFHFRPPDGGLPDEPELGYRLVRSAWGRGYATEGSRGLIDDGFVAGDVRRVVAGTMAVNTASRRVMEKVGMRLVRSFQADWPVRIPGDEFGDVEYAITREDWASARDHRGS